MQWQTRLEIAGKREVKGLIHLQLRGKTSQLRPPRRSPARVKQNRVTNWHHIFSGQS
ncbi:hypothetical protein NON20_02920 [Synechocystis sp. B12]|nr:hypothetical protein NON20_02920 [Synechocystis sp. B12]